MGQAVAGNPRPSPVALPAHRLSFLPRCLPTLQGVHRSNIPWSGSSSFGAGPSASAGASTPLGAPFGLAWYNGAMPAAGGLAAATQAAVTAAAAAAAHTHAAPAPAPAVDTWTYSGALCFSLGWHDPNENRGRRSWGRRRRAVAV